MISALVFDLDDTLFPERDYVLSGFQAVDAWLRNEKAIAGFEEQAKAEFFAGSRGDIFNRALRSLGVRDEPELVRQMVEVYRAHHPQIRLFPDARWALDHFAQSKKLGLLTDGYLSVQQRKVAALGIAGRFQAIVYSDRFGREGWKPSPLPYAPIAGNLGCEPSECAYVADNPAKDFIAARRLNWFTVRVRRPNTEHFAVRSDQDDEADVEIETLLQLPQALESRTQNGYPASSSFRLAAP
jgi:putative hydrolase of the HAD superfamily